MDRRRFLLTSLAGALATPLGSEAQPAKVARIGYLSLRSASADAAHIQAFRQGLHDVGYTEGLNVVLDVRYADGAAGRLPALASELVHLQVNVIVASPTPAVRAAMRATQATPIVMAFSSDPVAEGIVTGLARPGGNTTGLSAAAPETSAKRIEFLKVVAPAAAQFGYLADAATPKKPVQETEAAARALGVQVKTVLVRNARDLDAALSTLKNAPVNGLIVSLSLQESWKPILDMALRNRLPTVSGPREFVEIGAVSYTHLTLPTILRV